MNHLTDGALEETLHERAGAMAGPVPSAASLIDRARRERRRRTALATVGGAAATAAAVLVGVLATPSATPQRPAPASSRTPTTSTSVTAEEPLTIDEATRANAVHDWATALPAGPPVELDLGYRARRQGDRLVIEIGGEQGVVPSYVKQEGGSRYEVPGGSLSNPVQVADGWLFRWRTNLTDVARRALHVSNELEITVVAQADDIRQVVAGPEGRRFAVVAGVMGPGGVVRYEVSVHSLDGSAVRRVQLGDRTEPTIATWQGDVLTLAWPGGGEAGLGRYDLASGRWSDVPPPDAAGDVAAVRVVALPGDHGGDPSTALVAVERRDGTECLHLLEGAVVAPGSLGCAADVGDMAAEVAPGARYVLIGDARYGRVNTDHPARVLDVRTLRDLAGIPPEVLAVGVRHLYWEDDHTLIGLATRVSPVHGAEALFRWDLETASGESLPWDPAQSPFHSYTVGSPEEPAILPGP